MLMRSSSDVVCHTLQFVCEWREACLSFAPRFIAATAEQIDEHWNLQLSAIFYWRPSRAYDVLNNLADVLRAIIPLHPLLSHKWAVKTGVILLNALGEAGTAN